MSNCKPGELAQIVGCDCPAEEVDLGKLVVILGPGDDFSDEGDSRHYWLVRSTCGPLLCFDDCWDIFYEQEICACDAHLRPLRDPGEDAVDQMVLRLGKPARSPLAKVCDPQPVVVGAPTHGEVG